MWAAAIALGAIVAPPDAAAATAVLKQLPLPRRLIVTLEGESLFNDASALLIYRMAVATALTGSLSGSKALLRVPSNAVWEVLVFVLNVLAFILVGLQRFILFTSYCVVLVTLVLQGISLTPQV
jgi:NhaP-type Na+/H+ or K+/H+ antiporter